MTCKRILVISPIPTHPRNAGHRERIYQIIRQIRALGHDVHLLYVTLEPDGNFAAMRDCWGERLHFFQHDSDYTPFCSSPSAHATWIGKVVRRIGFRFGKTINFPYAADDWYDRRLDQHVRALQEKYRFDIVFSEYLFCSKAFLQLPPDVRKVLDTIDVFTNRHRRYARHGEPPVWFSTTRHEERKALRRADVIIAIQEHERQFFQQLAPEKQIITIGHFVELQPLPQKTEPPLTLLFLASSNQSNVHGFQWFLHEVWPRLHIRQPDVRVLLAGSICSTVKNHPVVTKIGEFPDARVVYEQADVVINPILFGTGVKIKNVEAMGYAMPLVTTRNGSEGLEDGAGTAFLCAEHAEDFARYVAALLSDTEHRHRLRLEAYRYAMALHERFMHRLAALIQDGVSPATKHHGAAH